MSTATLNPDEFGAVRQLTHQGFECLGAQLEQIGLTPTAIIGIAHFIEEVNGLLRGVSHICFTVGDELAESDSPTFGAVDSGGVLSIRTAKLFRVLWIRLLKCALETLGPRELFLRTGYAYSDLARAATPLLKQFLAEGEWVIAWEDEPA